MELVDLNKERRERSDNAEDQDVIWALRYAIEKIEKGEWKATGVYVAVMADGSSEGRTTLPYVAAGLNAFELRGLLAEHLHMQCDPNRTEPEYHD